MPHSSGGGSHSGGSHSSSGSHSSHSSSGGGSSGGYHSNRRTSDKPFPGSKMYLYYQDRKPRFIYSNYDLKNKKPDFVIEDNLDIFENEKNLKRSMKAFYEETGIVPAVITVKNEDWNKEYSSLEKYAYDEYVARFPDEAHWLIVYSEEIKDNGFNDWYWEGMQGDRTDPVLTASRANKFTESLHKRLLQREKYSVDEAIAATFDEYTPQMMNIIMDKAQFFTCLFLFLVFGGSTYYSFAVAYKSPKVPEQLKHAKAVNLTAVYQEACSYCGGIYIVGMHRECPHCGAVLPEHHYTKDANGNIIQIM